MPGESKTGTSQTTERVSILKRYETFAGFKPETALALFRRFRLKGTHFSEQYASEFFRQGALLKLEGENQTSQYGQQLTLIALFRFPKSFEIPFQQEGGNTAPVIWTTDHPVAMMQLQGKYIKPAVPVNFPATLVEWIGHDELGLSLNVGGQNAPVQTADIKLIAEFPEFLKQNFMGSDVTIKYDRSRDNVSRRPRFRGGKPATKVSWTGQHAIDALGDDDQKKILDPLEIEVPDKEAIRKTKIHAKNFLDNGVNILEEANFLSNIKPTEGAQANKTDPTDPTQVEPALMSRFPGGPILTEDQLNITVKLAAPNYNQSFENAGKNWLNIVGLYSLDRARQFLKDSSYYAWLRLTPANRVLMGSIAFRFLEVQNPKKTVRLSPKNLKETPAFRYGRSAWLKALRADKEANHSEEIKRLEDELDRDIREEWLRTFLTPNQKVYCSEVDFSQVTKDTIAQGGLKVKKSWKMKIGDLLGTPNNFENETDPAKVNTLYVAALEILRKALLILHAGLQIYDKKEKAYEEYKGAVIRTLSHGGRVNIRIPALVKYDRVTKPASPYAISDWLGITKNGEFSEKGAPTFAFRRAFGTHWVFISSNTSGPGSGVFEERGGGKANIRNRGDDIWGMNIAAGGIGMTDINGDVILPDGGHGHMFILYIKPTPGRDGALQVGMETTGPGAYNPFGYIHDEKSTEATANPESSFGGLKQDKVGSQETLPAFFPFIGRLSEKVRKGDDEGRRGRYVNLVKVNGGNWLERLQELDTAFVKVKEKYGNLVAYNDLIGSGELIKNWKTTSFKSGLSFLNMPSFQNSNTQAFKKTDGTALAFKGAYEILSPRFQTYCMDRSQTEPVVITQDTIMTYRTLSTIDAQNAPVKLSVPVAQKNAGLSNYRTLSYKAVRIHWQYPAAKRPTNSRVKPAPGSGVHFGCSIRLETLKTWAQNTTANQAAIDNFCKQLKVTIAEFKAFLEQGNFKTLALDDANNRMDTVLVESNFGIPDDLTPLSIKLPAEELNTAAEKALVMEHLMSNTGIREFIANDAKLQANLSKIRLRLRLTDQTDWLETPYKLGFVKPPGTSGSINENEGGKKMPPEGMIELFSWSKAADVQEDQPENRTPTRITPVVFFNPWPDKTSISPKKE